MAKEPFPPFRASVKDGYAVRLHSDRSHEQIYEVVGRSDAGGENVNKRSWVKFSSVLSFSDEHATERRSMRRDQYRC